MVSTASTANYTEQLRALMQPVGLTSFRGLSQAAGISERQIDRLRRGQIDQIRVEVLLKLSHTLHISVDQLLSIFSDSTAIQTEVIQPSEPASNSHQNSDANQMQQLQQEYQRLQTQLNQQRDILQQEFQQASLQLLESWLLFFPVAAHAAQQNPELPATKLLPLIRPIEQLLKTWGVEMLAPVGAELPYDPQYHQLLEGTANPGDLVKVRNPGYRQGEKLLHRAKVSLVNNE
jgi:molecular chaperone GrpE (heat shock protein)